MFLTLTSVVKILWCDHSNEISLEVLSCGAIFFFFLISQNEIWDFRRILPLVVTFGSERVKIVSSYRWLYSLFSDTK